MISNMNQSVAILLIILAGGLLVLFLFAVIPRIAPFRESRKYMTEEIRRTSGSERKRWMKKRRALWLTLLPFDRR